MEKCEVKKLIVKINDTEHTLAIAAARDLHKALSELFGEKDVIYVPIANYPQHPTWPYRHWEPHCVTTGQAPPTLHHDTIKIVS